MNRIILGAVAAMAAVAVTPLVAQQQGPPIFQLTWVDRQGGATRIGALPPGTFAPRLSPDGRRVAFDTFDGSVWIADLTNLAAAKKVAVGRFPMWSPDGGRLLFAGPKGFQLFWQAADGSGSPELLADTARAPESWSTAARLVSYITLTGAADYDVWVFSPDDRSNRALLATPTSAQMSSRFSPDSRWLAYQSNESGRFEIYVEPFPRTGTRTRITDGGGERPVWSPDGREIVFDRDATLYSVTVDTQGGFSARAPVALPVKGFVQSTGRRLWDLAPDGSRFLVMLP